MSKTCKAIKNYCMNCQVPCCYNGVYVTREEENRIIEFARQYLPEAEYIVDGYWPNMRSCRKTAIISYDGYDASFPEHFTKTRCIFTTDKSCLLQIFAIKIGLHPWELKPRACWLFPLREVDGKLVFPDKLHDPDKTPDYPGFVSFMPCIQGKFKEEVKY